PPTRVSRDWRSDVCSSDLVALISHTAWQADFDASPDVINSIRVLNGESRRIIGVMPEGWRYPDFSDTWFPLQPGSMSDHLGEERSEERRVGKQGTARSARR